MSPSDDPFNPQNMLKQSVDKITLSPTAQATPLSPLRGADEARLTSGGLHHSSSSPPAGPTVRHSVTNVTTTSHRSRRSRASRPPGSMVDLADRNAQAVFKCISENDYAKLEVVLLQ